MQRFSYIADGEELQHTEKGTEKFAVIKFMPTFGDYKK